MIVNLVGSGARDYAVPSSLATIPRPVLLVLFSNVASLRLHPEVRPLRRSQAFTSVPAETRGESCVGCTSVSRVRAAPSAPPRSVHPRPPKNGTQRPKIVCRWSLAWAWVILLRGHHDPHGATRGDPLRDDQGAQRPLLQNAGGPPEKETLCQ